MNRFHFHCRHRYPGGFELDADFDLGDGVTALFGPSGSGKTTILSIITGALQPDHGSVTLCEQTLIDTAARLCVKPERRHVGVVFQDHLLFPHLSVERNLRYGLTRRPSRPIDFGKLIELLELRSLLPRPINSLSGGQRQRIALGRAILSGPQLLLLDEPFSALDTPLKDRILTYLDRALTEWRIPTLFVSHDQADVRRLSSTIVILDAGKVVAAGPTVSTLDRNTISRPGSPSGPLNLLRLEHVSRATDHWEGRIGEHRIYLPIEPPADWLGWVQFLPRDVTLSRGLAPGISIRNAVTGMVREVVRAGPHAFVAVDVGQNLWAEVTPGAVKELNLSVGVPITCLIKASAIQLIG